MNLSSHTVERVGETGLSVIRHGGMLYLTFEAELIPSAFDPLT